MTTHPFDAASSDRPSPVRILVVEDNADHLEVASTVLQNAGYGVEEAGDGMVALARLLREPVPDLVVVDMFLPVLNGWQLITEMKNRPVLAAVPVVAVSGAGQRALMSAPVSAGYLEKPFTPARLLEIVATCLARRRRPSGTRPIER
jgi:CheY-like chemotaxis protein